jgi:hypothetical protein
MIDRKGLETTDYVVGYGRPPKATQFAAGKSGNPRGRPKGSRTVGAILQDILSQKIAVTENGRTRRIPTLEVMFRRLVNDAVRRDAAALKLLLPKIAMRRRLRPNCVWASSWLKIRRSCRNTCPARPVLFPTGPTSPGSSDLAMVSEERKFQALLRSDFRAFVHKAFTTLCPGQDYVSTWHVEAIAWQLERIRRGEIRRLIINMPPRSLKSIMASVAFPAFVLGHDPSRRIICVSYSGDLSRKHSNDFRALLESSWYRRTFPNARIGPHKNSETEIELTARGFRLATSVGGTLTGRGGDIIVIDDPLKPDDALSETKRSAANQWFANTLLSRLDDKRTGAIVIVMQRVHMDDLTGFLLSQSSEWELLSLPAIAEFEETIALGNGHSHRRRFGEALSPEREPVHVLEALKLQIGSDAFSAQYQQAPVPPGGAMVKRHWVRHYGDELPSPAEQLMTVQSWDTASKGGP